MYAVDFEDFPVFYKKIHAKYCTTCFFFALGVGFIGFFFLSWLIFSFKLSSLYSFIFPLV
jgi:hypothetical protein